MAVEETRCLLTEQNNPATAEISSFDTREMLLAINNEDKKVADAVRLCIPQIALAVDEIAGRLSCGGRLFYIGAGTSGRLALVDASECPCTFGTDPSSVQAIIAGGIGGVSNAANGDEDSAQNGENDLISHKVTAADAVVGITASGRTPYVIGAMRYAKALGAMTVGICNNPFSELSGVVSVCIAVVTGPEVIEGSTRMKAGTAQKMILNMITTGVMIKNGRVYGNRMVSMSAYNDKLKIRAVRMITEIVGCDEQTAQSVLSACRFDLKKALAVLLLHCDSEKADKLLRDADGSLERLMRSNL